MAERARKEVAEREAALRDKLTRERDEEIEVCARGCRHSRDKGCRSETWRLFTLDTELGQGC